MANPQKENGYTAMANEIMEALARIRINGQSRQVLDFLLRKTYGYNKKEDCISLSQFCLGTGLSKVAVCKSLKKLKSMNLITQKGNKVANKYTFTKDYTKWRPLPKKVTLPKKVMGITQKGNKSLPKKVHTIVDNTKVDYTKETLQLCELLRDEIKMNLPTFKEPNINKWAMHIDRMKRIDGRTDEQIEYVIRWCQQDTFWQANILSTKKLREKFDQLVAQIKRGKTESNSGGITII